MKRVVDKMRTLLVDGPASVTLVSGDLGVLGAPLKVEETVVVRQGKRLPLWTETGATFEVLLGEGASINEIEESAVPSSWSDAAKELLSLEKPVTVLVLGVVDSGKTSFCTFLVNEAVKNGLRTGVIDADLGQSDVSPPSTIGFNFVTKPIKDLFEIDAKDVVFVGSTSPSGTITAIIDGLTYLKQESLEACADFVVINTDGWVENDEATEYKVQLIEHVSPSAVVGIHQESNIEQIMQRLTDFKSFVVESPQLIQSRTREKRKILRELSYKKYMKGAKMLSLSFGWIKVIGALLGSGVTLHHSRLATLIDMLGVRPVYSEESLSEVFVVLRRGTVVVEKNVKAVEEYFGKRLKLIWEGDENGLLVGLKDEENHFLGIGILQEVDYKRKNLKIYTPVTQNVGSLSFGQIKLNKNLKEIGLSTVYSKTI
jgi:polynucleotide 5'-hydroxyl-kinase GRC3/NOL9